MTSAFGRVVAIAMLPIFMTAAFAQSATPLPTPSPTVVPNGTGVPELAAPNARFPPIDYDRLKIELARTGCYGPCPDYTVTISGDGIVIYSGRRHYHSRVRRYAQIEGTLIPGVHRAKIDRATLDGLIEKFRRARFFGLKPRYEFGISDMSSQTIRFTSGARTYAVIDYMGTWAGMPPEAKALEDAIDAAAGTARWVTGNAETLSAIRREGFDPRGPDAGYLALAALWQFSSSATPAWQDSDQFVLDLIAAGMPLEQHFQPDFYGSWPDRLGSILLAFAVRFGHPRVAQALIDRAWIARTRMERLTEAFASGAGGCDALVATQLVRAGVNVNARGSKSDNRFAGGHALTALQSLAGGFGYCKAVGADERAVARALIAVGADVNVRDDDGESVLSYKGDTDLTDLLLAAGAHK